LAQSITAMSDGHLKVTVYPAGSLVRALETFDAVGAGAADMYHSFDGYFESKSPALNFFGAVPYGMTADELCAWLFFGGGQALWDEVDAQFNIKPLMATNTGTQMGGWFNEEVNSPADFKGLRYRMAGLGAEVLRRMGATVVTTPGGQIMTALKSGAIDAAGGSAPGRISRSVSTRRPIITTTPASTNRHELDPRHKQDAVGRTVGFRARTDRSCSTGRSHSVVAQFNAENVRHSSCCAPISASKSSGSTTN
jgi:TRAP-type C4-dicarboxylate transport system substrate-binding protein